LKPIFAVADDFAFSAAYALTSAADRIFVTRMGAVGSVGVVVLHTEDSKFNDEQGFKYTYIFKGDRKVDGNPHEPLSERAEKDIQSEIDRQYEQFVATVARNRKADAEKIVATQAGVYWSENAVPLLADEVERWAMPSTRFVNCSASLSRVQRRRLPQDPQPRRLQQVCPTKRSQSPPRVRSRATVAATKRPTPNRSTAMRAEPSCTQTQRSAMPAAPRPKARRPVSSATPAVPSCAKVRSTATRAARAQRAMPRNRGMAPLAGVAALAGVPLRMRPEGDIEAIGALCKMAGCPDKAAEFLTKKKPNGQYFSVADISEELTAARVIESERSMITSHVNPNQARSARFRRLKPKPRLTPGRIAAKRLESLRRSGTTKLTKERAYALMLEEHPEVYGAFVAQHNAKGLIATLERAGVRLPGRAKGDQQTWHSNRHYAQ